MYIDENQLVFILFDYSAIRETNQPLFELFSTLLTFQFEFKKEPFRPLEKEPSRPLLKKKPFRPLLKKEPFRPSKKERFRILKIFWNLFSIPTVECF